MALKRLFEVRVYEFISLALFFLVLAGCRSEKRASEKQIYIVWEGQKAIGVLIPLELVQMSNPRKLMKDLTINVENNQNIPVIGEWSTLNDELKFEPLVPFTPGITYELYSGAQPLSTFVIVIPEQEPPRVVGVYPSTDTVPENLLKMYVQFSGSMKEGEALANISILNAVSGDTLEGTFLDLQPELWNEDNTMLTLWLDPGRIKRGLIPNRELGIPLIEGTEYQMIISNNWRGANGRQIRRTYIKELITGSRDSHSPDPEDWTIHIPVAGSDNALEIEFGSPLDAVLAIEALTIFDVENKIVAGSETLRNKEAIYSFKPDEAWRTGNYYIQVQTRLEDLAGNNINRLFDENMSEVQELTVKEDEVELSFHIQ